MSSKDYLEAKEAPGQPGGQHRHVMQHEGTEPSHHNQYWADDGPDTFFDIVSGQPRHAPIMR